MRSTGGSRRDAPWCVSAPSCIQRRNQRMSPPARVPATRDAQKYKQGEGLRQGARDACILLAPLIMHRFSERHRIATQMTTQRSDRVDLYRVFTPIHLMRNGFTAYNVISPENGSFASVAPEKLLKNLTPAPRRQDHTTSPYASVTHVSRDISVHRISPRVRDDGQRPSVG
jgi:hypothetical protein